MGVQPSPAVQRAARALKVLAADPSGELPLSVLARRLGVHRSSCQTLVLALCAEGLLTRHEGTTGPTYRLGPALVELGEATKSSLDVLELVDAALVRLRDRFGTSALAGQVSGDAIVVVTASPVAHPFGYTVNTGTRVPLRAPIGAIYVAWASHESIDAWCARADPPLTRLRRHELLRELAAIRDRGWSATVRSHDEGRPDAAHEATTTDLQRRRLAVVGLSAAVWDEAGQFVCSLALAEFPTDLSGRDVGRVAAAVRAEADGVTAAIGGHAPGR